MAVMAGQASAEFWPRSLGVIHLSAVLGELLDPPRKILLMLTQKLFILISPPLRGARWGAKSTQERLMGPATHIQADYRDMYIHSFMAGAANGISTYLLLYIDVVFCALVTLPSLVAG